jgi:starch synthase
MIAMRYGSLPIVRETGGLKDTVTPYNKYTNIGVGFTFKNYDQEEFKESVKLALSVYHDDQEAWQNLIRQAMHINHSLEKMAKQYETLYLSILDKK